MNIPLSTPAIKSACIYIVFLSWRLRYYVYTFAVMPEPHQEALHWFPLSGISFSFGGRCGCFRSLWSWLLGFYIIYRLLPRLGWRNLGEGTNIRVDSLLSKHHRQVKKNLRNDGRRDWSCLVILTALHWVCCLLPSSFAQGFSFPISSVVFNVLHWGCLRVFLSGFSFSRFWPVLIFGYETSHSRIPCVLGIFAILFNLCGFNIFSLLACYLDRALNLTLHPFLNYWL